MCPLRNLRGENPHFKAIFGPKIDTLSPAIPYCGKSKTMASICGYVSTSTPNMVGSPHPSLRSAVPLVWGVGKVNFEST